VSIYTVGLVFQYSQLKCPHLTGVPKWEMFFSHRGLGLLYVPTWSDQIGKNCSRQTEDNPQRFFLLILDIWHHPKSCKYQMARDTESASGISMVKWINTTPVCTWPVTTGPIHGLGTAINLSRESICPDQTRIGWFRIYYCGYRSIGVQWVVRNVRKMEGSIVVLLGSGFLLIHQPWWVSGCLIIRIIWLWLLKGNRSSGSQRNHIPNDSRELCTSQCQRSELLIYINFKENTDFLKKKIIMPVYCVKR
jgi:hypothetical protein